MRNGWTLHVGGEHDQPVLDLVVMVLHAHPVAIDPRVISRLILAINKLYPTKFGLKNASMLAFLPCV